MANYNKEIVVNIGFGGSMKKSTGKTVTGTVSIGSTIGRAIAKKLSTSIGIGTSISRSITKKLSVSVLMGGSIRRDIQKNITARVDLTASMPAKKYSFNLNYFGTKAVGLGSPGGKFNIIINGSFKTLSITINGKTLTYTGPVTNQSIIVDNVRAIVKVGGTYDLSHLSGDVLDFLKLIPGDNAVTISKAEGDCSIIFDFTPLFL